jgi:hypothetical protein
MFKQEGREVVSGKASHRCSQKGKKTRYA